jgi:hypothetical protein
MKPELMLKSILEDFLFGFEMFHQAIVRHQEYLTDTSTHLNPRWMFWFSVNIGWVLRRPISRDNVTFYHVIKLVFWHCKSLIR